MRSGQIASTARGVALVRAIEMARPAAERVASDPYARSFVNPLAVLGMRLAVASGLSRWMGIEGMMNFALARERHIHELIVRQAADGVEQLVILGAGFDTRAYRTAAVGALSVFEVDHPTTQAAKRKALAGVVAPLPGNVVFVPVDFDRDDLGERLGAAGYDAAKRTLFVWQGVTVYLTPAGIDRTLAFVAGHSGRRSAVVFDYIEDAVLAGGQTIALRFFTRAMGETMSFGIDAEGIGAFLQSRGFRDVENIDGATLKRLYFTGANAGRPMAGGAGIALGFVR